ncbi:hypothetical protein AAE478_004276 [Parahypoxylon ruwenzoriense]
MDGSPNFFTTSIQDGESDSYELFDDQNMKDQAEYRQHTPFNADSGTPFVHVSSARSHLPTPSPMDTIPGRTSIKAMGRRTRNQLATLQPDSVKVESPGLSSGSSETSESHSSRRTTISEGVHPNPDDDSQNISGSNGFQPPEPLTKRRRQRKQPAKHDAGREVEFTKRNRCLERNRVAATKCRQKKKEWVSDLEETKFGLESQNSHLQMEYSSLKNEITQIKSQLMEHASCNDPNIDKWIENEAKRFVLGASERYDQMLANVGATPGLLARQDSISSASGYPTASGSEIISPVTPSHRGSISFPPGVVVPNSPIFYRTDLTPNMPGATSSIAIEASYHTGPMPGSIVEDATGFDNMSIAEGAFQDSPIPKG